MVRSSSASEPTPWRVGGGLLLAVLVGACDPQIDQPTLVDLGATLQAYDAPSGVLTRENAEALIAAAAPRLRSLSAANPQELLAAAMNDLGPALESRGIVSSDASERSSLSVDASLRLRMPCPGSSSAPPGKDAPFGRLDLTTRVDDNVLAHVVQGHAYGCTFAASALPDGSLPDAPPPDVAAELPLATLDGDVFVYRYDALNTPIEEARFLLVVAGSLTTSAPHDTTLQDFDARLLGPVLETRLALEGSDVVAFVEAGALGLRDARTRYTCDVPARRCSGADGGSVSW